jgi:hypothetical protein
MRLCLIQKDDCHLCDAALAVLAEAAAPEFDSLWLEDSDALRERYGMRVPVLRCEDDGGELDWPFDAAAVRGWLAARQA